MNFTNKRKPFILLFSACILLTLLFSFITGIFLLFFLWVSYSLVTIFVVQPDNNHVPYLVPEHAKLVVNINGQEAFEELLQHLLLEGKGDEFIRKIKELARGNRFEKEYGINWARPVSYFESTSNAVKRKFSFEYFKKSF